ncbi:beta-ketoacyl-ACP synthase III [Pseudomaricurvus sp.]|uniref:beta-ketoacyl-ACP synthase III n=1 Tax=Pseudomaricurvus sp. TaxID=2004510 RepID=UPI003F6B588F
MNSVYINDIAVLLPNQPVDNDNMERILGQVGSRPSRARRLILRSNGIRSRYYAIDPETGAATHNNAQLTAAAIKNLENEAFTLEQMDCLVCGTSMPDQVMPNHAVMVHGELASSSCEVVATAGVCVAGMTALKYAWMGVASGQYQNAVATGSEVASAVLRSHLYEKEVDAKIEALQSHPEIAFEKDFLRWMLSDGAGAIRLQPKPATAGLSLRIDWMFQRSYANEQDACMYSGAQKTEDGHLVGWKECAPDTWLSDSVFAIKQDVKQLNENIIHYTVEKPLAELIEDKQLRSADVDFFLPHYSSEFFRDKLAAALSSMDFHIPFDRWATNLTTKGNTGSASIYIMLEDLFRSGRLQKGHKILCYVPESGRFSSSFMMLTVCDNQG